MCEDLEDEVLQLKEVIWERLDQERGGIEAQQKHHQEEVQGALDITNARKDEMRGKLLKLQPDAAAAA